MISAGLVLLLVAALVAVVLSWRSRDVREYPEVACTVCNGSGHKVKRSWTLRWLIPRRVLVRGLCGGCGGQAWFPRAGSGTSWGRP